MAKRGLYANIHAKKKKELQQALVKDEKSWN